MNVEDKVGTMGAPLKPNPKMERPPVVRVATVIAGLLFFGAVFFSLRLLLLGSDEQRKLFIGGFKDPIYAGRFALSLVCFPALIAKPRGLFTFYATATLLLLMMIASFLAVILDRRMAQVNPASARATAALYSLVLGWLLWRFCLGRPSREFFGFAPRSGESSSQSAGN